MKSRDLQLEVRGQRDPSLLRVHKNLISLYFRASSGMHYWPCVAAASNNGIQLLVVLPAKQEVIDYSESHCNCKPGFNMYNIHYKQKATVTIDRSVGNTSI